jgi:glycosyltransferase involved in cell wall biosynthesis
VKILFVHQNFPGQYKHLASAYAADPENEVVGLTMNEFRSSAAVKIVRHTALQSAPSANGYLAELDTQIRRGESAANAAWRLREEGFIPDVICAHPGWGEALFIKGVFPAAKLLCYQEFYYQSAGSDVNFDPEYPTGTREATQYLSIRNANILMSLAASDWNVSPTAWQRSQFPGIWQNRISVIHEGIDTNRVRPDKKAWLALGKDSRRLCANDEVITFVNRNLEPYRGFHTFMRCLPELLRRRPNAHVVIVGGDEVSYGQRLPDGETYRQRYSRELEGQLDFSRIWFVGRIDYATYLNVLQISSVHVYLTYPFVLSWSMLEAMSVGVPLIASSTHPVNEVVEHGKNGILVDFFSPSQICQRICEVLDHPTRFSSLGENARDIIKQRYDLETVCLPQHLQLIRTLVNDPHALPGNWQNSRN